MTKYKTGDIVRIRPDLMSLTSGHKYYMSDGKHYDYATGSMLERRGQNAVIVKNTISGYYINESEYTWTDEMFEDIGLALEICNDDLMNFLE